MSDWNAGYLWGSVCMAAFFLVMEKTGLRQRVERIGERIGNAIIDRILGTKP